MSKNLISDKENPAMVEKVATPEDDTIEVYIRRFNERNPLPSYKTDLASGMDLYANIPPGEEVVIGPGESVMVGSGIAVAIPDDYEIQIRPRSGLAYKNQITVINTPGTIDADYRDEIGILLINHGKKGFVVRDGDRIAQAVLQYVPKIKWTEVDRLEDISDINRGGGFGSTGV